MKVLSCKKNISDLSRQNETDKTIEFMKKSKTIAQLSQSTMISGPEAAKLLLVRLIYLLNNAETFDSSEQERLLCEMSKLFRVSDHRLKRIIYKILRVMINKQSEYAYIQSIVKDLMGSCSIIRQDALKMIPYIKEEQLILLFKKYLFSAINDQNILISDTAMIALFHLLRLFPNLVITFSQEIIVRLNYQYLQMNNYSLILAYYMKQDRIYGFIKTLHQLIQQPKCPRMNMQLIRIIGEIISTDTYFDKSEVLLNYVYSQVQLSEQRFVFFQAIKSITRINHLSNVQLQPFIKILFDHLQKMQDNIELFSALSIICDLALNRYRKQLIQDQLWYIEYQTSSAHAAISRLAFMILFSFWKKEEITKNLQQIFEAKQNRQLQIQFMQGLMEGIHELITVHLYEGEQIIAFINAISEHLDEDEILFPTLEIFYYVMKYKDEMIEKHINSFILLVLDRPINIISVAVSILYEILYDEKYMEVNEQKIYQDYRYYIERFYYNTPVEVNSRKLYEK